MLLFRFDNKSNTALHPDAVKLEPLLGKLPSEDLLFIILCYDYFSPYQQLPENQRFMTACRRCYDTDDFSTNVNRLKPEIEMYRSLQYDIRRETIKNYELKIASLNLSLLATDSTTEIKKNHEAIDFLTKSVGRIQRDLYTDELVESSEGTGMNFLERWQENKRKYKNDSKAIDLNRQKPTTSRQKQTLTESETEE